MKKSTKEWLEFMVMLVLTFTLLFGPFMYFTNEHDNAVDRACKDLGYEGSAFQNGYRTCYNGTHYYYIRTEGFMHVTVTPITIGYVEVKP